MSIYGRSIREDLQDCREENSKMQDEIDTLVMQRDDAMDQVEELTAELERITNVAHYWEIRFRELDEKQ